MNAINTINFTTRTEYKNWVAAWKQDHAGIIRDIRKAKLAIKASQRDGSQGIMKAYRDLNSLHGDLHSSLSIRAEAKVEANRQYHAEKALEVAVAA